MFEGLKKLYTGDFNHLNQVEEADGSLTVTLSKRGGGKVHRFRVRDLYGKNEEVLEHEILPARVPEWILDRMKKAGE